MDFIGRARELALLEDAWAGEGSAFIPVYGRRRVGKSELILRFLRGKTSIYHLGKPARPDLQIRDFLRTAAVALDEPLLESITADGWKSALEAVVGRVRGSKRLVLALDEFQWTAGASPELPAVLQELWDRQWRESGRVLLILCGSYVGFMEREVLGKKSPLFGRRTAQILLRPFPYHEAAKFHAAYGEVDRARTYFLCGGVPHYLRHFRADRSVEANLVENLLDEHAPLYREPDFLLREELREVDNYYAILFAIAAGNRAIPAMARATAIPERSLHYYLDQLCELGYLARRHPLSGERAGAKSVRFVLDDPLLRFWFRFVYPNASLIQQIGGPRVFTERIRPELDAFFGSAFERLCREALPYLYAREGVAASFEIGSYWARDVEIDVVATRDDNWIDLGECKWGAVPSAVALARDLDAKVGRFPNPRNATIGRRVFTRSAPRGRGAAELRWHTLADLYAAAAG